MYQYINRGTVSQESGASGFKPGTWDRQEGERQDQCSDPVAGPCLQAGLEEGRREWLSNWEPLRPEPLTLTTRSWGSLQASTSNLNPDLVP